MDIQKTRYFHHAKEDYVDTEENWKVHFGEDFDLILKEWYFIEVIPHVASEKGVHKYNYDEKGIKLYWKAIN